MLVSRGRSRERILLFGMEGVGKSLAALDIAAAVAPSRVFVIDNDNAWDRMLEGQTLAGETVQVAAEYRWDPKAGKEGDWEYDDRWCVEDGNVIVYHTDGWLGNVAAVKAINEEAGPDDWCCIDSGTAFWADVQDWYTDRVFDRSLADHLLALKLANRDEDKDEDKWQIINAQYNAGVGKFLVNPPCHLIVTAEQKDVNVQKERDKAIKGLYGAFFVRPAGQKRMGHNVQTVLHLTKRKDEFYVTTVKDRGGREAWADEEITGIGFAAWYLGGIAGWIEEGVEAEETEVEPTPVPKAKGVVKKNIVKKG